MEDTGLFIIDKAEVLVIKNGINLFTNSDDLFRYLISLDWDKFASQSKNSSIPLTADLSNNELFNEEEFKYLLETGELDKISSNSESENESET